MRLALLASHPIQYQAPLFRELAQWVDLQVFFAHRANEADQANAGFGVGFTWDVDLLSGYRHHFLHNVSRHPGLDLFEGCDTPSIASELAHGSFGALLVMGWHLKSFWQGIWAAKRAGIPVMVRGDSHLDTPRSAAKRVGKSLIYPLALRVFDAALYVGERSRRYWEHYGYPARRLFFSPHCVDNAWFADRATQAARAELRALHGIPADARVALFAGKLIASKRPLDLIYAARKLATGGVPLTVLIAGSGSMARELAAAAGHLGVRLVELGFCNQSRMPAAYSACDALVLPSEHETWGLVANEALACGRPVVVSDACGCAPDLAADGRAGRVFHAGDIASLADALAGVLSAAPPTREAIAARACQYGLEAAARGITEALHCVAVPRRAAV
jgi:glycosyltransferase involved in cell wall biosynthesis